MRDTPLRILPIPFPAYNLRWLTRPVRLVHGVVAQPGLVGFCHEVPVGRAELERDCPELALRAAFLEGLRHAAPSPDAVIALCAGYVAHGLRSGPPLDGSPPARPAAWPDDNPWPWEEKEPDAS